VNRRQVASTPRHRTGRVAAFGLACALAAASCKGGANPNGPPPPTGTGGTGVSITGTGGTLPPPPPSGMVIAEITKPTGMLIAPGGSLLDVEAHVFVDQGSDFVDPTSVKAVLTHDGDTMALDSTKLAPQGADTFSGRISLGDLPTGDYALTVTGVSSGGLKGTSAPFTFQIDGGPTLIVRSPQPLHPYKGLLVIEVMADAGPFGPLDGPHASVANIDVPLDPVPGIDNTFRGMLDLHNPDPAHMTPPLIDEQLLTVYAINANMKRNELHIVFSIDETGPEITLTSPMPGQIVGDIMRISATVTDPSGVLDSSVIAVIGDDTTPSKFSVQLKPDGIGVYSTFFDTRKLTGCDDPPSISNLCIVYPTISFRASDELGNEHVVAFNFTVDNIAPVADLDPPNLRSFRLEEMPVCSWEFDPLGVDTVLGDMPNDTNRVPQVFDLRARIEDDGNHAAGLKLTPVSGVDPEKTAIYVLDDELQPLIVDTDGDGWCDSINPLLIPTTEPPVQNNQVLKIRLAPVPPGGVGNFVPDQTLPLPPTSAFCRRGTDPGLPLPLCPGHQPSIAIAYAGNQPAIWTLEHIDINWCFGEPFDTYANNIGEGWACIAVATTDLANNFNVSPPLRVDIDYKLTGPYGQAGRGNPPACTGTWDRATNTVTPGPCKTRRFERQPNNSDYYCFARECPGPALPLP
jgi:hypothetical protein